MDAADDEAPDTTDAAAPVDENPDAAVPDADAPRPPQNIDRVADKVKGLLRSDR